MDLNNIHQISPSDLSWLLWGGAFLIVSLAWTVFRNKKNITVLQQKINNISIEIKKMNKNLTVLLQNSGISPEDSEEIDENKLYVGNIDYAASESELAAHFSKFGQIEMVNIPTDRYTGRARGFGFVTFKKSGDAMNAMKLDGSEFKGRQIQVNFARERVSS